MWRWDPRASGDDPSQWEQVAEAAWLTPAGVGGKGKSDFMLEVHDDRLWTFGGDREVLAPWPQDNDVWSATLPRG